MNQDAGEAGTAYRIRTGDLRLERAVSWASRRMRRRVRGLAATGPGSYQRSPAARHRAAPGEPRAGSTSRKPADRLGDLLVALLADHEAVVRVRPERLERRAQPLRQPLRRLDRHLAVERRRRRRASGCRRPAAGSTGTPWQHLAPGEAALVRLLAQQVLDPGDVVERQVALVALSSFSGSVAQPIRPSCRRRPAPPGSRTTGPAAAGPGAAPTRAGRGPTIGIRSAALSASRPPIPWPTSTVVGPSRSRAATTSSV